MMVEEILIAQEEVISVGMLKRILPKQVMHQTLMAILDYLQYSGKIVLHEGKVLWTFKPQSKLKQLNGRSFV
jgi:chromosome segregation and condensation protein ScpB